MRLIWAVLVAAFFMSGCATPDLGRMSAATVRLDDRLGIGSGVLVRSDLVLTARHVIVGGWPQKVTFADLTWVLGTTVWISEKHDLALVRLDRPVALATATFDCDRPELGEPVIIVGTPLGVGWVVAWGRVGSARTYDQLGLDLQVVTITVARGMSGAAVFDDRGNVRGILKAGAPMMAFMVAADVVCAEVLPQLAKIEVAE